MDGAVNLAQKLSLFDELCAPRIVGYFNDCKLQVGKIQGEFVWHSHPDTDDFFLVVKGRLTIQLRDRDVEVNEGELFVVPARRRALPACGRGGAPAPDRAAGHAEHRRLRRRGRARGRDLKARLSTDGGARGNPGPAAYGYVLEAEDGTVLAAHGEAIGVATNNVAEYRALIAGLEKAVEVGVRELEVVSDSELLVKQMKGEYRVKNEALRELSLRLAAGAQVGRVRWTAVRREHNELADRLVNEALDAAG